jgi:osmotically-inducible protein OsmY
MIKKWLGLIGLLLLQSGCIAVFVAGAASAIVYDKRGVKSVQLDTQILHELTDKIAALPNKEGRHVTVNSFNQIVLLVGEVPNQSIRMDIERLVQKTNQVKRVYNQLVIDYPLSYSEKIQDSMITSQVKTYLVGTKGLSSGQIRVVTENRIVYLMGVLSQNEAELAVSVVRDVPSVDKVVKVFQWR